MKKYYLIAQFIFPFIYVIRSQNLVEDNSFEKIETFKDNTLNWYWLKGTADLWDTSGYCLTENYFNPHEKTHQAVSGIRYIGLVQNSEYLSGHLSKPLEKNKIYEVSVYVKIEDKAQQAFLNTKIKTFPIRFSINDSNWTKQPFLILSAPNKNPLTSQWTKISAKYKANGGENRITIGGCLADDCIIYCFYDDIVVVSASENIDSLPIQIQEHKRVEDLSIIYFDTNSDVIKESEKEKLQKTLKILNDNKSMSITIGGFTDIDGSDTYNIKLGERRAKNVKDYLLQNGYVDNESINIKSFGKSQSSNSVSKAENRHVELFFTPKSLNAYQKEAIVAASKLYGYVRWFYPTDVLDKFNWDKFLNKTIIQICNIKGRNELQRYIIRRFLSIAPELRFFNDINSW